jgi:orotidine-5'-phosphate decarboxylase
MKWEENPIIVALDGMQLEKALEIAEALKGYVGGFKVNDLLDSAGPEIIIGDLKKYGLVMADPKLHDIPNTVKNRMKIYAEAGADIVTVMASGGVAMMIAAMEGAETGYKSGIKPPSKVAAVTVLTSLGKEECHLAYGAPVKAKVLQFARIAFIAGVEAIVCSAQELEFLNKFPELDSLERITPGITPKWAAKPEDQNRVTPPSVAIKNEAKRLVIGRAITQPPKEIGTPADAVQKILGEIEQAREEMETGKK